MTKAARGATDTHSPVAPLQEQLPKEYTVAGEHQPANPGQIAGAEHLAHFGTCSQGKGAVHAEVVAHTGVGQEQTRRHVAYYFIDVLEQQHSTGLSTLLSIYCTGCSSATCVK